MIETRRMPDFRTAIVDVILPPETLREFSELIPKPHDHVHYKITGDSQINRGVFRVDEGDGVLSDYTFPEKSDTSKVQFATRRTYTTEQGMLGRIVEVPVTFDRRRGAWKKLNPIQRFGQKMREVFHKETNIPAQIVTEHVNGRQVPVLHTLEAKRPVGMTVQEAALASLTDAKVDVSLKYKLVEHKLTILGKELEKVKAANSRLRTTLYLYEAKVLDMARRLGLSQQQMDRLRAELDRAHQQDAHYSGPINTPLYDQDEVVEGQVVG